MILQSQTNWLRITAKYLSFLVFLGALCYPAYVCAYPLPEQLTDLGTTEVGKTKLIIIEFSEVAEIAKVAFFTQLLEKSPHISNLRLSKVQLATVQPERSFVRWSAHKTLGAPDDLELGLQLATDQSELFIVRPGL